MKHSPSKNGLVVWKTKKVIVGVFLLFCFKPSAVYAADGGCWSDHVSDGNVVMLSGIECVVQTILNYALRIGGLAVFLMLIVGGIKYLLAGGDPEKAAGAQKTLTYAIFGLALIIISWIILLLIQEFAGINLTEFSLNF